MVSIENLKILNYQTKKISKKHKFFLLLAVSAKMKMKEYL